MTEKSKTNLNITLRGVIYREGATWIAHCLEMDIVAEGKSPDEAAKSLDDLCRLQIKVAIDEGDIESIFRPAPREIWKMFFISHETSTEVKPVEPVSRFETRELALA